MTLKERLNEWLEYGLTTGSAFLWRNVVLGYVGQDHTFDWLIWFIKDIHTLLVGLAVAAMLPLGKAIGIRIKNKIFPSTKKTGL